MNILVYSEAVHESQGGGANSTNITVKYLQKSGNNVELCTNLKDFEKKIMSCPEIVLHHNVTNIYKITRICKAHKIPIIATLNMEIACLTSTHITNHFEDVFGTPCFKCGLLRALKCNFFDNKYPWKYRIKRTLTIPYRHLFIYPNKIKALKEVDGLICIGNIGPDILRRYGIDRKMYVSPQPIDDEFLISKQQLREQKKERAVFLPKSLEINRPTEIIDAFLKVDSDFKIVCSDIKANYFWRDIVPKYMGNPRVKFIDKVPFNEIKEWYLKSYLTVFPLIEFGTFGRAWAESLCCGTPVLSFRGRGAADDYLTHKENGYFMDYNSESIKNAFKDLLTDEKLYEKLQLNGWEFAKENLVASKVIPKLLNIYKEVLAEYHQHGSSRAS
jgi:glycosyltransferase involved in cell wall biosynthesis